MTLRLHNTLTGTVEPFAPLAPPRVSFYTCGPTVYDFAHIGNFRSFLAADVLRRWLESPLCQRVDGAGEPTGAFGYDVTHVMNITDVGHMVDDAAADGGGEDKMEAARKRLLEDKKSGKLPAGAEIDPDDPHAIAEFFAGAFLEDGRTLGLRVVDEAADRPELMPRPTGHVRQMLEMVEELLANGHAYIARDGVAYFDTSTFPDYGRLSGNTRDTIRAGAGGRVSQTTTAIKKHPADFMLWKPDPTHLMRWDPTKVLGKDVGLAEGYPGWHLECSAMARELLGDEIDLHSGGEDNIFPHHECEIAQSCGATGKAHFARYWFHPRFLLVEGEKMSKSKGTFFTVRDLLDRGFSPAAIRLELIKTHYRANASFTEQGLTDSARQIGRWRAFLEKANASSEAGARNAAIAEAFAGAMDDDLNIAGAIGVLSKWIGQTPAPTQADASLLREIDGVLGVVELVDVGAAGSGGGGSGGSGGSGGDAAIEALVKQRDDARASKDWAESDRIRDELTAMGVEVKDAKDGATWSRVAKL